MADHDAQVRVTNTVMALERTTPDPSPVIIRLDLSEQPDDPPTTTVVYHMRGYDTSVSGFEYWDAEDPTDDNPSGNPLEDVSIIAITSS